VKSASVNTRVDPLLKEQAEAVLNELGMSMSTAMSLFLKQIVIHNGIPFELSIPREIPISYSELSSEDFNKLMIGSEKSYEAGLGIEFSDFKNRLSKDIGL